MIKPPGKITKEEAVQALEKFKRDYEDVNNFKSCALEFTAFDLAADWWWVGRFLAFTKNGRQGYEEAVISTEWSGSVKLSYLEPGDTNTELRLVERYVNQDKVMVLRPIGWDK
jgi:hypothetical protein